MIKSCHSHLSYAIVFFNAFARVEKKFKVVETQLLLCRNMHVSTTTFITLYPKIINCNKTRQTVFHYVTKILFIA